MKKRLTLNFFLLFMGVLYPINGFAFSLISVKGFSSIVGAMIATAGLIPAIGGGKFWISSHRKINANPHNLNDTKWELKDKKKAGLKAFGLGMITTSIGATILAVTYHKEIFDLLNSYKPFKIY